MPNARTGRPAIIPRWFVCMHFIHCSSSSLPAAHERRAALSRNSMQLCLEKAMANSRENSLFFQVRIKLAPNPPRTPSCEELWRVPTIPMNPPFWLCDSRAMSIAIQQFLKAVDAWRIQSMIVQNLFKDLWSCYKANTVNPSMWSVKFVMRPHFWKPEPWELDSWIQLASSQETRLGIFVNNSL